MKEYKRVLIGVFIIACFTALLTHTIPLLNQSEKDNYEESAGHKEHPELIISPEEQAINKKYQDRLLRYSTNLKSASTKSSIADGALTGTWNQFKFLTSNLYQGHLGFRVDGSLYDKENDVIYAISYAGHLYRINRTDGDVSKTDWELLNHKNNFLTYSYAWNNWYFKYYDGLNLADGSFRMIRSMPDGMEYSDNEGRSWTRVANLSSYEGASEGAIAKTTNGNKIYVLIKKSSSLYQVYVSEDNGVSYNPLSTNFNPDHYQVRIFKAHNSESVFIAAYNKSTSKVSIYEHTADGEDFELISTSAGTIIEPNIRSHIIATMVDGTYHIYIGSTSADFYYSTDKGASWTHTTVVPEAGYGHYNVREVHPTKPNLLHRGFLDLYHSKDYGKTWEDIQHHLGWDVQHSNYYQRKDNSYFLFIGNDMGCFINDNPDVKEDYVQLNNGSPSQMCYDVDHGQHTNTSFSAMQDRGVTGYNTETKISESHQIVTHDGLRATLSYNETSVWTWEQYGLIRRRENFLLGDAPAVGVYVDGSWWACPMIASPNPKEDAMYLAYGPKLTKLTYNPVYNKVVETLHHYDFNKVSGQDIGGFGYSSLNKNRWYVSVKNGDFYSTTNGGQTFEKSSYTGIKPNWEGKWHKLQHVIKASKKDEKTVYYAGKGNTFLISTDGGKTFKNHNNGLDVARVIDFDATPDDKFIFAACWGAGAWVYSADADQWYPILDEAIPATGINFTDAEFIDKKNEIRFGTYGSGILSFIIDGQELDINYPDMLSAELTEGRNVLLQWEDKSDNEDVFIIERAINGVFSELTRVDANQTTFTDSNIPKAGNYIYRISALNATAVSYKSNYAYAEIKESGVVDKSLWTLVSVDSEDVRNPQLATYAFDDIIGTFWFTQWSGAQPPHPHEIIIDMNATNRFLGFSYLPRQDGKTNGIITGYEFYISSDSTNWNKVSSGAWDGSANAQEEYFSSEKEARYIKLVALSCVNGTNFSCCAELSILTEVIMPKVPETPVIIQGGRISDSEIELVWLDLSKDEDGFIVEQMIDGVFTSIYTSDADATTYQIANTDEDITYIFRVVAFNSTGSSVYSDTLTINAKGTTVGIQDQLKTATDLKVYPNPFTNELKISADNLGENSNWQIFDLNGRIIKTGRFNAAEVEVINAQELKTGTYIIKVQDHKKILSKTIIKK